MDQEAAATDNEPLAALFDSGVKAHRAGLYEQAMGSYALCLRMAPQDAAIHQNVAGALSQLGHKAAALAHARKASELNRTAESLCNLGSMLWESRRYDEAQSVLEEAFTADPNRSDTSHTLGLNSYSRGNVEEAIEWLRNATRLAPDNKYIQADLSLVLVAAEKLTEGMRLAETRWDTQLPKSRLWNLGVPEWKGEEVAGKVILVHHEQGFGDTFQFIRYIPWLTRRGAKVVLAVPDAILYYLRDRFLDVEVIDWESGIVPPCDYHTPLLSMIRHLGIMRSTIPAEPYLPWIKPLPAGYELPEVAGTKLRIGITWSSRAGTPVGDAKSVGLAPFMELAGIPGVQLYSLQKIDGSKDIAALGAGQLVYDLSPAMANFGSTACFIQQLDLVISMDTAVAHLAAGMGLPVWNLMPKTRVYFWWFRDTWTTPWYRTMRLYIQEQDGDWHGLMKRVAADVRKLLHAPLLTPSG